MPTLFCHVLIMFLPTLLKKLSFPGLAILFDWGNRFKLCCPIVYPAQFCHLSPLPPSPLPSLTLAGSGSGIDPQRKPETQQYYRQPGIQQQQHMAERMFLALSLVGSETTVSLWPGYGQFQKVLEPVTFWMGDPVLFVRILSWNISFGERSLRYFERHKLLLLKG